MAKPTEDYWITVRFKSNGIKERTFTGSDDNVLLCNFVKDNFINAKEIEYNWSFSKEKNHVVCLQYLFRGPNHL